MSNELFTKPTLKIEDGKYYRTRDGRKAGPMLRDGQYAVQGLVDGIPRLFFISGRDHIIRESQFDLIDEWADEPSALPHGHARLPSGKIVDLTVIEKPFGLLDADTQAALMAHGGPYEILRDHGWGGLAHPSWHRNATYRARPNPPAPAPVLEKVVLMTGEEYGWSAHPENNYNSRNTHRITFDLINGKPDENSIRMEAL